MKIPHLVYKSANEIHNFRNRLYSRLLLSEKLPITIFSMNDYNVPSYMRIAAVNRKIRSNEKERKREKEKEGEGTGEHFPAENEHRDYTAGVQYPCSFSTVPEDAAAARRERRRNFAVVSEVWAEWGCHMPSFSQLCPRTHPL